MALHYTPLDESKDEIRLLTILPKSQYTFSEVVQCRLDTRSLISITEQYQAFISLPSLSSLNKQSLKLKWIQSRPESDEAPLGLPQTIIREPPREHQRFIWGDYAALSYVWGDEENKGMIIVNGHEIRVTRNLEAALRAFRDGSEFYSNVGLWVDAICINQADVEERSRQVRKMRDIYGKAWTVIAWLGEQDEQSDKAIQLVQSLSEFHHTVTSRSSDQVSQVFRSPSYSVNGSWYALEKFMARPYWYRLWVIQEIVMGASAMEIRCGASSINWNSFCSGIEILQEELWLVKDELLQRDVTRAGGTWRTASWSTASLHLVYRDLSVLSQGDEAGESSLPLWRLIDIANFAECQDPRDKVYGLIGLMGRAVEKLLVPNYTIPPHDAYTEVSKAFITSYQRLDPIREGNPWGPTKTPSWVADWLWDGSRLSQARIENRLWGPAWLSGKSIQGSSDYTPYATSLESACEISFMEPGLLVCNGFIVDTITGLSARGRGFFTWSKTSMVQTKEWKSIYGDISKTSEALYKTLIADRVGGGQKSSDRHAVILNLPSNFEIARPQFQERGWIWLASQYNYYFRWERWRKANKTFQLGDLRLDDFFSDTIPDEALEHDLTEVYSCFDRTCQKRRFMLTKDGYMGWAPDNIHGSDYEQTKKGDMIATLFGCSTPIVIRPCGEVFQVIGEAYIQGIMDGEAMEFLKDGKVAKRSFTFC